MTDNKTGPAGCWTWTGTVNGKGYGSFVYGSRTDGTRRKIGAHRYAYEKAYGPVPDGYVVHHDCYNRRCVNPSHLRATTQGENLSLKAPGYVHPSSRRTHCPQGHPYDESNTAIRNGRRHCRECGRAACRAYYVKRAAARKGSAS